MASISIRLGFLLLWLLGASGPACAQNVASHKECLTQENRITIACGNNSCPGGTTYYRTVNEAHPACNRNPNEGVFRLPCGVGVIEGRLRSNQPVLWKVEGQPDVTIFQSVGNLPTLLTNIEVCGSGVVANFQNFNSETFVTYSPSCKALEGGGETVSTFRGKDMGVLNFAPDPRGGVTVSAYHNHSRGARAATFYSPDCLNPLGGGNTQVIQGWKKI